jgi:hypothetical protein
VSKFRHINMSECDKSWSDLQRYMIEQSNLEKIMQNKLRIEDIKIVVGQLESQEYCQFTTVQCMKKALEGSIFLLE